MTRGVEVAAARVHGWFRLAVAGRTEEECLERARQRDDLLPRSRRVSIEHPRGQYGLLREFIPGEPVSTAAYRRRLPALYVVGGCPDGLEPAGRPARPLRRLHRRLVAAGGHVRHPLRHRGAGDLRAGAGRGWARRRQERAARADHLRGRTPRHPLGGARPLRAAGPADRAAGAARAQRAPRPHHGGQRNAEPVRRGRLAGAQRLPDRRRVRRGPGAGRPGPQAARDGRRQDAAAALGERAAADLAGASPTRSAPTGGDRSCLAVGHRRATSTRHWTSPTATWWPTTCATWPSCRCPGCSSPRPSRARPG